MAAKVLLSGLIPPMATEMIAEFAEPVYLPEGRAAAQVLAAHGSEIRALVLGRQGDAGFLSQFPNLGLVANMGVGYDGVDVAWCADRGIIVANTPDILNDDVADTAVALTLMAARRFGEAERYLRAGRWLSEGPFALTGTLVGKRIGILGFGRIGQTVARRFHGFEVTLAYHDTVTAEGSELPNYGSAADLAEASDILICILPGGPGTTRLVDAQVLAALGPDGILVNVGRGTAVDQAALIAALSNGTISGAGLDVYEFEPDLPQALLDLEHVVLFPHVASGSLYTRERMSRLVADNVRTFLEKGRALTPVPETPNMH